MEALQREFIRRSLAENSISVESIAVDISLITREKFKCAADMRAASKLIQGILSSRHTDPHSGTQKLSSSHYPHIKKMKKLSVNSRESDVFTWTIPGCGESSVIVKTAKNKDRYHNILREFFIGKESLNLIREAVPTVMYTFGAFSCPLQHTGKSFETSDPAVYTIFEHIPGKSVRSLLLSASLSFPEWLSIFIQLLITLEIAQRQCSFTHFDLHSDNVMVRQGPIQYSVPLGHLLYSVSSSVCPAIIDFGQSCVEINEKFIGSYEHLRHGMLSFLVSGSDIYKFLVSSANAAKNKNVKHKILSVFEFYGCNDPYQILTPNSPFSLECITNATKEYCREVTYSPIASTTPSQLLQWILSDNRFATKDVSTSQRKIFENLSFPSFYSNIDLALEILEKQTKSKNSSYTTVMYNANTLEKYLTLFQNNPKIDLAVAKIKDAALRLLPRDKALLERAFSLKIPTNIPSHICNVSVVAKPAEKKVDVSEIKNFTLNFQPFLQFYYTITELSLAPLSVWATKFRQSKQMKFFLEKEHEMERCLRWQKTLAASVYK